MRGRNGSRISGRGRVHRYTGVKGSARRQERQDGGHRLPDEREHPAGAGVEEQRLLIHDQVLVEAEASRHQVHGRADPVDPVRPPEVIVAQAMPALRAMPSSTMRMRLLAREGEGDRLVGEYTFAHTASATGRQ